MILNKFKYITDPENARVQDNGMRKYQWGEKLPSVTTILSAVPDQSKRIALARWRERDEQVKRWNGSLLGVSGLIEAAAVPRMLRWAGLRPLWHGVSMWVRPANLRGGIDVVKDAVARALGGRVTGQSWSVFELHGCDAQDIDRCRQSFLEDFDGHYARRTRALARMRLKVAKLPMEQAAATSFKIGSAAITEVLSDPLLHSILGGISNCMRQAH